MFSITKTPPRLLYVNVIALFVSGVLAVPAIAGGTDASNSADSSVAEQFVRSVSDDVLAIIQDNNLSNSAKEEALVSIFNTYVDTNWMGKYYRQASEEQQKRYLELYHEYLLRSYVPRFRDYAGGAFEIQRVVATGKKGFNVQSIIKGTNGDPDIRVDYTIKKNGEQAFRIVDIKGEGVSLLATQRSDFAGLISRKGLSYFLEKLEGKVAKLHNAIVTTAD